MTQLERRRAAGVALLTQRRQALIPRLRAAGISFHHIVLQDGPQLLPNIRPPLLLDTVGLELPTLVALLVELQRSTEPLAPGLPSPPRPRKMTTMALISPGDTRCLRLLSLCAVVRVIASDRLDLALAPFTRHLSGVWSPESTTARRPKPALLGLDPPPDLKPLLSPLLLPALAALQSAPDTSAAARACGMSRATLMRVLSDTRAALGLPGGSAVRYRPPELAAAILGALAKVDDETNSIV